MKGKSHDRKINTLTDVILIKRKEYATTPGPPVEETLDRHHIYSIISAKSVTVYNSNLDETY